MKTARPPAAPVQKTGAARTRLLLEGPIASTLIRLAAPNVVVNVVLIAVTASVDAHFVGRLGASALAGLSLVFPLLMLMQQMANSSMGGAIASAIARSIGAGRRDDAAALVVHGLLIAGFMAAAFTTLLLVGAPTIYALMGGKGEVLAAAVEYSNAIFGGALAYWLLSTLTSVVRGTGQPTVLAVVYLAAEALHIVLVPTLVFGIGPIPPLGITGAGVATVASFAVSAGVLIWYVASGRTPLTLSLRAVKLERRLFTEILRVGAPMSFQPILNNLALATLTAFVGTLGPTALAGFGVAVRLEYIQYPLTFGLGAAVIAMVGTNIGAGQWARATRIAWTAAALAVSVTGSIGVLAFTWPGAWTAFFSGSPAVHLAAVSYLGIAALAYPFLGMGLTMASTFQAVGRPIWPLLATASRVVVVAGGGWIAIHAIGTGLAGLGVVAATGLVVYGTTLATAFRLRVGRKPVRFTPDEHTADARRSRYRQFVGTIRSSAAGLTALIAVGLGAATPAHADEIRILSAAALQSAFPEITRGFEGASGHTLRISYATIGVITRRVLAGEAADVVIGSTLSMPALTQSGKIDPGSQLTVCRTGIGVVVPSGTPKLEIGSVEEFKRAVLAARVVVYADPVRGGAAGVHIGSVFKKLGIVDELKSQMTLAAGGDVTEVTLAQGAGALGLTQISEIVGKPAAEFVGPLPQELQNETVFVAGTPTGVTPTPAVTAFLAFLKSPVAGAAIQARGMQVDERR